MKALVTGGAGFIGSTLVDRLLAEGHEVDVVDDLSTGSLANLAEARADRTHRLTFHQIDIRDAAVVDLIARRRPEVVFHLAAQTDVRASVARPGPRRRDQRAGDAQRARGRPAWPGPARWSFASSGGTIYGEVGPADLPIKESQPLAPASPYGVAKGVAVDYLNVYRRLHGLEYTALALANVYGPRQDPHGEAGRGRHLRRPAAGRRGVHDLRRRRADPRLRVRRRRASTPSSGPPSGATGCSSTSAPGSRPRSTTSTPPWPPPTGVDRPARSAAARPGELARSALDPTRAAIQLGWRPWTDLAEGTARVVEWFARPGAMSDLPH